MLFRKSPLRVIIESVLGFMAVLFILFMVNVLDLVISNYYYEEIVKFMEEYFYIVVITSVITFFANMFKALLFPLNLPSAPINALNSLFFVYIMFKFFELLGGDFGLGLFQTLADSPFRSAFYVLMFVVAFFFTVIDCMSSIFKSESKKKKDEKGQECKDQEFDGEKLKEAFKNAAKEFKRTMKD